MDNLKLKDKVAIVTGTSSGMGREIAVQYVKEGAKVIALARRAERLEELKKSVEAEGHSIDVLVADVCNEDDINKAVDMAVEKYGTLDILVNNAGIFDDASPVGEVTDEVWNKVLDVDLTAVMKFSRKALSVMLKNKSGSIVNVASIAGLTGVKGGVAYGAAKHGVIGMTKNTAFMYADAGIRCNAICPGDIGTEVGENSVGAKSGMSEFGQEKLYSGFVLNPRQGKTIEIATVAVFLASEDSSFVNGVALPVDGGWIAY